MPGTTKLLQLYTSYSKMVANLLFFHMHVDYPSLPHFPFVILLYFAHVDEAQRANLHGYKRVIKWSLFWTKVYTFHNSGF